MAMGSTNGSGGLNAEMNVTPLIDVLLVLLIIFMVIVPVTPSGLDAQLPQRSKAPSRSQDSALVVQILAERGGQVSYKINREDVAIGDLGKRLNAIFAARADKAMLVKADAGLDFSVVAQVMDIAKSEGADHIGLITPKGGA